MIPDDTTLQNQCTTRLNDSWWHNAVCCHLDNQQMLTTQKKLLNICQNFKSFGSLHSNHWPQYSTDKPDYNIWLVLCHVNLLLVSFLLRSTDFIQSFLFIVLILVCIPFVWCILISFWQAACHCKPMHRPVQSCHICNLLAMDTNVTFLRDMWCWYSMRSFSSHRVNWGKVNYQYFWSLKKNYLVTHSLFSKFWYSIYA